jgi:Protein of unknown function (DUF2905)
MSEPGKILVGFGVVMVMLGGILVVAGDFSGKVPWLGRLPADIYVQGENFRFCFPLAVSILLSLLLTLRFSLLRRH